MPPRCTWSTTSTITPVGACSCAMISTPASGLTAESRSTLARTARASTARLSTQISPLFSTWMLMLSLSVSCGSSKPVGRFTMSPASFTNTAVMMKKISRLITKSSIGARSMPCDPWCPDSDCRLTRMTSEAELVRQQLGLPNRARTEMVGRPQPGDADRESGHRADHRLGHAARHAAGVGAAAERHRVEHLEHAADRADQPEQRRHGDQHLEHRKPGGHRVVEARDHRLADLARAPGRVVLARVPLLLDLGGLARKDPHEIPVPLEDQRPHQDTAQEDPNDERPSVVRQLDDAPKQWDLLKHAAVSRCFPPACRRSARPVFGPPYATIRSTGHLRTGAGSRCRGPAPWRSWPGRYRWPSAAGRWSPTR